MRLGLSILLLSVQVLSGCGGGSTPTSGNRLLSQNEILLQSQVWNTKRAGMGYVIEYTPRCFCAPLPAKVRVTTNNQNQKTLVELLNENGVVYDQLGAGDDLSLYLNIEDFFTDMTTNNGGTVSGQFDPTYGFPSYYFKSPPLGLADGEVSYEISLIDFF